MICVCKRCERHREHKARGLCKSCYVMAVRNVDLPRRKGHSHLRVVGARRKRRYANAKLSHAQLRSAFKLYEAGMSTADLAEQGWQRWGYANQKRAMIALSIGFRRAGYPLRDQAEAQRMRWGKVEKPPVAEVCGGCGCPWDIRTIGCDTCKARHWYRLRQAKAAPLESREAA